MFHERVGPRWVYCLLMALVLALLCQAVASAEPWPDTTTAIQDNVVPFTVALSGSGASWTYTVTVDQTYADAGWRVGGFAVYAGGLAAPLSGNPADKTLYWNSTNHGWGYDGGWESPIKSWHHAALPDYSAKIVWEWGQGNLPWADGKKDHWVPSVECYLKDVDPNAWTKTYYAVHISPPDGVNTFFEWEKDKSPAPQPVPEPGTLALLATGALGMLPRLRRRRTT